MRTEVMFPNHRWSGWPGAICHYCGQEDPMELCLAFCPQNEIGSYCIKHPPTTCPATLEQKLRIDNYMNPILTEGGSHT